MLQKSMKKIPEIFIHGIFFIWGVGESVLTARFLILGGLQKFFYYFFWGVV
jgi:hypothetical protein